MKTAFLFPGQGAQYSGMAKDLFEASGRVRDLFALAKETTGIDVQRLLFEGTDEELKETVNTQVSVTLANLSAAVVLSEHGVAAQGTAGFSLGEYSALVEAGVLEARQIFPLVKLRGELMAKAAATLDRSGGDPGMAAVIGLSPEKVDEVLAGSAIPDLFGANYNSPNQVVISGTARGLASGIEVLKASGARRVVILKVSGPFHSPLLSDAARALEEAIASIPFRNPEKLLFSNVTGKAVVSGAEAKRLAVLQVTSPVRWITEERSLVDEGFDRLIEAGPGAVLAGLWGSFSDVLPCLAGGKLEQIQHIV